MKNFIVRLIFTFIVPFIVILIAVEWGLRSIPNDYEYKEGRLSAMCDTVKVLSFGSSHGHYGIRPDCMNLPAFNIGMPSQSIKFDHFLFYKYIDKCPQLTHVILPVSYFSLFNELEEGAGWAVAKGYTIYMGYEGNGLNPIFNLELINKKKYLGLVKMIGGEMSFLTCDSLGWGNKREFGNQKPNFISLASEIVMSHNASICTSIDMNVKRLKEMIATCAERDINVILLLTPTHSSYFNLLDSVHLNLTVSTCKSLEDEFPNTTYLNFLKDSSFVNEDFYDPDHLNTIGARKLTEKLNDYLK